MKKFFIFLVGTLSLAASAQDVIQMKNGEEVSVRITKISPTSVEYKKWSNLDGPLYSINTSDIYMINFENGEKEIFNEEKEVPELTQNGGSDVTKIVLRSGTIIPLKAENEVRGKRAKVGEKVSFYVARDILADDKIVIPFGTKVYGTVYLAKRSKWFGTRGYLGINVSDIQLPDGVHVPLSNGNIYFKGDSRFGLSFTLFMLCAWPCCFITGTKAVMPIGYEINTVASGNVTF